ncbi:MAG TPA: rod shape-determining protein RodA [Candidatus Polarisedimenticolaceae bacterium]|nr:rod shape-determining protein RodA [Candidatus Polarisedimenticolaceae bacterium]
MLRRRLLDRLDVPTIVAALALAAVGMTAIASATAEQPGRSGLWKAQLVWLGIASLAALVVVTVDYHIWAEFSLSLHGFAVALLVAVLVFGKEVGGNKSWLALGPVTFQPSEFAKWTTCLATAAFLAKRVPDRIRAVQGAHLTLIIGTPMLLIAKQPDMGTALTFVPVFLAALLIGGLRWRWVAGAVLAVGLLAPFGWHYLKPYQRERILTVVHPDRDPSGVGYQVRQSKIAVGSGGLTGKGLFKGTQNRLNFLPAPHTDFVLSVVSEELGFIGSAGVLVLLYYLLYRGLLAARSSQDRLGTYLSLLVVSWFMGQAAINIGMVLGLMPTIGVPLPFLSYGGTALISVMCGVGLIANVRGRRFVN